MYPNVTGPSSSEFWMLCLTCVAFSSSLSYRCLPCRRFVPSALGVSDFFATYDRTSESGNQLIMALSYTQKTSDNSLITKYVRRNTVATPSRHSRDMSEQQSLYDQFATYLVQNGLYMPSQFSADSFAGPLANQTNLGVKVRVLLDELLRWCPQLTNVHL